MSENLVIFDCDGVLVDSEFVSSKVIANALTKYGYFVSVEDFIRKFTGITESACRQLIMEESGIDIPVDYWTEQQPHLQKAYETELSALMLPVLKLLNTLKIPRCIATNSAKNKVVQCLELTKQIQYFADESIFSSSQVSNPKPAPDVYLFAAQEMGVKPENCIVVEDSPVGTSAALAAGMQVMVFLGGNHARFNWYRDQMSVYNQPIFPSCSELLHAIQQKLGQYAH